MTGGGIYPALAVQQTLNIKDLKTLWITGESDMESRILKEYHIDTAAIPSAGLHGVGLKNLPKNSWRILQGYFKARRIIREFKPDVLFTTGGYLSIPVVMAASRNPIVAYIPDIEPGYALKYIIRRASAVTATVEETHKFIPTGKVFRATGYPIRPGLQKWTRDNALQHFKITAKKTILLVFGGSKGARSINLAVQKILPQLLKEAIVLHITGNDHWEESQRSKSQLPGSLKEFYYPYPFLHEDMGAALACSDLAVCRAGGSILGELPYFGLPAILIPYPYAWKYQQMNAEYLANRGAAVILNDKEINDELLSKVIELILDQTRLEKMRHAIKEISRPNAAKEIGEMIIKAAFMKGGQSSW
jgi:UDP-N-acetylglucosamine--N-acetylmuramyl-(pentapeptide) pyrophosphoryl-undecaprenol N-acetylglucosamine transferase